MDFIIRGHQQVRGRGIVERVGPHRGFDSGQNGFTHAVHCEQIPVAKLLEGTGLVEAAPEVGAHGFLLWVER